MLGLGFPEVHGPPCLGAEPTLHAREEIDDVL